MPTKGPLGGSQGPHEISTSAKEKKGKTQEERKEEEALTVEALNELKLHFSTSEILNHL
jgi:hypothetical protein